MMFITPKDAAVLGLISQVKGSMKKRLIKRLSPKTRDLVNNPFLMKWKQMDG